MAFPRNLRAVVFDCDGVLVNSEDVALASWDEALSGLRSGPSERNDKTAMTGATDAEGLDHLTSSRPYLSRASLDELYQAIHMRRVASDLVAYSDTAALLDALRSARIGFAAASNSSTSWVQRVVSSTGIEGFFEFLVGADQVVAGKPEPFVCNRALNLLGAESSVAMAVEDSPTGITSAKRAGLRVLAVDRGLFSRYELAGANLVASRLSNDALIDAFLDRD